MKRLILLFLLALPSLWADDPEETFGMKNGRYWNHMLSIPEAYSGKHDIPGDTFKVLFLVGLTEGWKLEKLTKESISVKEALVWQGGASTLSDLASTVSAAYEDAENQPLPIGWVVMGALAVHRGDTTRDLIFMALRKHLTHMMDGQARPATALDPTDIILQFHKK